MLRELILHSQWAQEGMYRCADSTAEPSLTSLTLMCLDLNGCRKDEIVTCLESLFDMGLLAAGLPAVVREQAEQVLTDCLPYFE